MKTITAQDYRPPLLLAVLMSEPPEQQLHLSSLSPSPTPPSSLPSSPNPCHLSSFHNSSLHNSSLHKSSKLSPDFTNALIHQLTAEEFGDDGVEIVMEVLSNEKATPAPVPSTDVDKLLASWKATDWGATKPSRSDERMFLPKGKFPGCRPRPGTESKCPKTRDWTHSEDCILADIFTRIRPERQKEELKRRLPKRSWAEAQRRYRIICDRVCTNQDMRSEKKSLLRDFTKGFWRRRTNDNLKPQCFIAKTLSKLR